MPLHLQGSDELKNDLQKMATDLNQENVVGVALRSGARIIEDRMKQNASTDPKIRSGNLHSSIRVGNIRNGRKGNGKRITIGVHKRSSKAYYSNFVEFGHGGPAPAPAHPYVRPAFDMAHDEAYEVMKNVLKGTIKRR